MKRVLVLAALFLSFTCSIAFAGVFGPPQPAGKGGTVSFGPGLLAYQGEWDDDQVDASQIQAYAQLGYALTDNIEFYLQGGAADLEVQDAFVDNDFEDGFRPFGAVGFKALISDRHPVGIGVFARGTYFSSYDDEGTVGGVPVEIEFDESYEIAGGIALQTVIEGAIVYAGPFFYLREGDVDLKTPVGTVSGDFEEDGNFGGLVGIRWPLKNGINIDLEGQFRTKFSGGGAILFSF